MAVASKARANPIPRPLPRSIREGELNEARRNVICVGGGLVARVSTGLGIGGRATQGSPLQGLSASVFICNCQGKPRLKTPTPNPSPAGQCLRDPIKREGLLSPSSHSLAPRPSVWGKGPGDGGLELRPKRPVADKPYRLCVLAGDLVGRPYTVGIGGRATQGSPLQIVG